ncbi:16S rRNA (adenine(1518)-N(6)/adenine(1519)-N(6))-dimethyltransferase RsmA [Leptospirillum ferriphilum]|nr:16S rRNA (adenine(1518)-N(6)/adenine(1519)-N(6))-dimethyltransferase RsmA [Leptospirillum ferriphilum]
MFPLKKKRGSSEPLETIEKRIRPHKSLGQNFLSDPALAFRIASMAREAPVFPCRILEIGPGKGILSGVLATMTEDLWLVERDRQLAETLRKTFSETPGVRILEEDAMEFSFGNDRSPYILVSNLPYNISVPLYLKFLASDFPPVFMVLMFQREVAKRLLARTTDPDYGHLSVVTSYLAQIRKRIDLAPGAFYPAPKVHSSVVTVLPLSVQDECTWAAISLSRKLFCYRRKSLGRALRTAFSGEESLLDGTFFKTETDFFSRKVDSLSPEDFRKLAASARNHHLPFFDRMTQQGKELLKP